MGEKITAPFYLFSNYFKIIRGGGGYYFAKGGTLFDRAIIV